MVQVLSEYARTMPQTRPVDLSKTQAPESPGTIWNSNQYATKLRLMNHNGYPRGDEQDYCNSPPKPPLTQKLLEKVCRPCNLTKAMALDICPLWKPLVRPQQWTMSPPRSSILATLSRWTPFDSCCPLQPLGLSNTALCICMRSPLTLIKAQSISCLMPFRTQRRTPEEA